MTTPPHTLRHRFAILAILFVGLVKIQALPSGPHTQHSSDLRAQGDGTPLPGPTHPDQWEPEKPMLKHVSAASARDDPVTDAVHITEDTVNEIPARQPESQQTVADMMNIDSNMAGDLAALLLDIATTAAMVTFCVVFMSFARRWYPLTYSNNVFAGEVPFEPEDSFFGWARASLQLTCEEAAATAGLDQALLIVFQEFATKVLLWIGVPFCLILCPAHLFFGGQKAQADNLSKVGVANDQDRFAIWWVNAASVWYVVLVVQYFLFSYQRAFLSRRFSWLWHMPEPRSKTVLVTGIPYEYCTDDRLKEYFNRMFKDPDAVQTAFVVKHTKHLRSKFDDYKQAKKELAVAEVKWLAADKDPHARPRVWVNWGLQDAITYYEEQLESFREEMETMRDDIKEKSIAVAARFEHKAGPGSPGGFMENSEAWQDLREVVSKLDRGVLSEMHGIEPNTRNGFVTFSSRHYQVMALNLNFRADDGEFRCEVPPAPGDVIYKSLMSDEAEKRTSYLIGYAWIFAIFLAYMPFVMRVSTYTNLEFLGERYELARSIKANHPLMAEVYDGIMGSLGIEIFMSMLPTALSTIFSSFWEPRANAYLQTYIQDWYFYFLVMFVLLVTGLGTSLWDRLVQLAHSPVSGLDFFWSAMPRCTHFYMNYVVLNCVTQGLVLTRYVNLIKFLGWRVIMDEQAARERSEPEDPNFFGIGSRSARFSLVFAVCLVFSSLSPLITVLGIMYFSLNRVYYGYLLVFAECRKADLGGVFWQQQLKHVQVSVYIYIALMSGVCSARAPTWYCALIPLSAGVFHSIACMRFKQLQWHALPYEATVQLGEEDEDGTPPAQSMDMTATGGAEEVAYCQPELYDVLLGSESLLATQSSASGRLAIVGSSEPRVEAGRQRSPHAPSYAQTNSTPNA